MRAMILAAGHGTRMRPLTEHTPKPLLEAGGRTLIGHILHDLRNNGITEVVINHAWLGEQIESALGDGSDYNVAIRYSAEKEALETAGGIVRALPLITAGLPAEQPFVVVNGDLYTDYPYLRLVEKAARMGDSLCHLVLVDNPEHHPEGDFVLDRNGGVRPRNRESGLTFSGIGLYRPSLFSKLPAGVWPLAPVLREAMAAGRATAEHYVGCWRDVGTVERLEALREELGSMSANG